MASYTDCEFSVHWRVRCARYVGLIMIAVCLACPPMPPVSRAMKHSRCAVLLDEPTLRAGRSVGGKQSALAGKALPTRRPSFVTCEE